ncbi:KlaA protein [Cellvibrio zantedeschiae]|uniref:KlaA protein n=1 Tax=Cellvibrio zantedeschiae TaxID=1237077 RepID=A0ABQ3AS82_9GAMM|nr:toxic anion resistance protein [Cellvibrio zantedeschiae]GGY66196.1 KlaA protein [Cellvibrio zantedeschiae]
MAATIEQEKPVTNLQVLTKEMIAPEMAVPAAGTSDEMEAAANKVVDHLFKVDVQNETAKAAAVSSVETMGLRAQQEASRRSQMLKQPIAVLARNSEDGGPVAKSLLDLRDQVEDLDPNKYDFSASGIRRLLGSIPGIGSPIRRYFSKFQSSEAVIDNIVAALEKGGEQLKRDNITLADDQKHFRELAVKLAQAVAFGQLIDAKLVEKLNEVLKEDPLYSFIEQELLFPLRQRIMDLQQQQAVAQQSVLTVEVIIRNNKELIRGVQRALNVTVNALSTAVTLALALENQRITLEKVKQVNQVTNDLIAGTAAKLRTQGVEIHKQAASTMLDMEVLKKAFQDIAAALDDIERFRSDALPAMQQTIQEMDTANIENAERIETLIRGRESQTKMGVATDEDIFEFIDKPKAE